MVPGEGEKAGQLKACLGNPKAMQIENLLGRQMPASQFLKQTPLYAGTNEFENVAGFNIKVDQFLLLGIR
jgi:hypothetical protein